MLRILYYLGIVDLVWLESCSGIQYLTIKKKNPFGEYWCHVYPYTKIGHVILNEDGTCSGKSTYIERWVDYRSK